MTKLKPNSLANKIWLTVIVTILVTISFSYLFSNFFYEKLYVEKVEKDLSEEGRKLALDYTGGPITDEWRSQIDWYNQKNESEVFVVSNPKELSACLPFDINHDTWISEEERQQLLAGNTVTKTGYEERLHRQIKASIVPLIDDNGLQGIIYLYIPLVKITELTREFTSLFALASIGFIIVSIYYGTFLVKKLTKPLADMKKAAYQVEKKDYQARVPVDTEDEIGQLGKAFNSMAESIQKEDERKKEFLANVSHELRTPISYIKGYSEVLLKGMEPSEQKKEQYLALLYRESHRMERLVGDLFDLSRLDSKGFRLEMMPLPLAQVVIDSLQKYLPIAKERGIYFKIDLDPEVIILGDEGRLEQVLQNVVDNALRYTEHGGITVRLSLFDEKCQLIITDTGIGIPEEDLKHITSRFYRVNKGRTRKDGGTGLGLSITEKLIHLHQGEMKIDSMEGKGTTVEITLPIIKEEEGNNNENIF